jgi:hypothetical protein
MFALAALYIENRRPEESLALAEEYARVLMSVNTHGYTGSTLQEARQVAGWAREDIAAARKQQRKPPPQKPQKPQQQQQKQPQQQQQKQAETKPLKVKAKKKKKEKKE